MLALHFSVLHYLFRITKIKFESVRSLCLLLIRSIVLSLRPFVPMLKIKFAMHFSVLHLFSEKQKLTLRVSFPFVSFYPLSLHCLALFSAAFSEKQKLTLELGPYVGLALFSAALFGKQKLTLRTFGPYFGFALFSAALFRKTKINFESIRSLVPFKCPFF